MKTKFFLLLEPLESISKRFRPAYRQAGLNLSELAAYSLKLASWWLSVTGKEMVTKKYLTLKR
jgi:hypothetical protein